MGVDNQLTEKRRLRTSPEPGCRGLNSFLSRGLWAWAALGLGPTHGGPRCKSEVTAQVQNFSFGGDPVRSHSLHLTRSILAARPWHNDSGTATYPTVLYVFASASPNIGIYEFSPKKTEIFPYQGPDNGGKRTLSSPQVTIG